MDPIKPPEGTPLPEPKPAEPGSTTRGPLIVPRSAGAVGTAPSIFGSPAAEPTPTPNRSGVSEFLTQSMGGMVDSLRTGSTPPPLSQANSEAEEAAARVGETTPHLVEPIPSQASTIEAPAATISFAEELPSPKPTPSPTFEPTPSPIPTPSPWGPEPSPSPTGMPVSATPTPTAAEDHGHEDEPWIPKPAVPAFTGAKYGNDLGHLAPTPTAAETPPVNLAGGSDDETKPFDTAAVQALIEKSKQDALSAPAQPAFETPTPEVDTASDEPHLDVAVPTPLPAENHLGDTIMLTHDEIAQIKTEAATPALTADSGRLADLTNNMGVDMGYTPAFGTPVTVAPQPIIKAQPDAPLTGVDETPAGIVTPPAETPAPQKSLLRRLLRL